MSGNLEAKLYAEGRAKELTGERLDRYVFGILTKLNRKKDRNKPIRKRRARGSKKRV